jgi:hypothetical protein
MKKLLVLTVVGLLTASALGCQCRRLFPWRNGAVPTARSATYDRVVMPPPTYSESAVVLPSVVAPSGGCGPGCGSCRGN